ncbi:MAG: glycosyltransferase family 4 protein [Pseudomonadota bacterium]
MKARKVVLVFVGWYLPGHKSGGPVKTLANLIESTHDEFEYRVVTRDRDLGDATAYPNADPAAWRQVGRAQVRYISPGWKAIGQIRAVLRDTHYDVLYLNSFFSLVYSLLPQWLNAGTGRPVVLGPRGQFSSGALELKPRRKRLFIRFYRWLGWQKRVLWQASTGHEKQDILAAYGEGVDIFEAEDIATRQYASHLPGRNDGALKAVFLSRLSPKKNLDYALNVLGATRCPVDYDIYGPIEDQKHWTHCESLIRSLPDNIRVTTKGTLASEEVIDTLSRYDVFFFPTKGENFGHVIAEALCAGLPLLIADTTPWRKLEANGVGWDLPLTDPGKFARKLAELYEMSPERHARLRQDVIAWAKDRFERNEAQLCNRNMFNHALKTQGIS